MRPLIIGVAGGSGSGKTTVALRVAESLDSAKVAFLDMDAYYRDHHALSHDELRQLNWDHPDAFDLDLLAEQLEQLAEGRGIQKPVYDFVRHRRAPEAQTVEPADVIVIDGILLLVEERIRSRLDIEDFKEPAKLDAFLTRFAARWQAQNGNAAQAAPQIGLGQPLLASFDNALLLSMQLLKGINR